MNKTKYVVCVRNEGYQASLEIRKIYEALPDTESEKRGFTRVVDESGEDYLYPQTLFFPIEVPFPVTQAFANAS